VREVGVCGGESGMGRLGGAVGAGGGPPEGAAVVLDDDRDETERERG